MVEDYFVNERRTLIVRNCWKPIHLARYFVTVVLELVNSITSYINNTVAYYNWRRISKKSFGGLRSFFNTQQFHNLCRYFPLSKESSFGALSWKFMKLWQFFNSKFCSFLKCNVTFPLHFSRNASLSYFPVVKNIPQPRFPKILRFSYYKFSVCFSLFQK